MTVKQDSDKCGKLLLEFKMLNKFEQQNEWQWLQLFCY